MPTYIGTYELASPVSTNQIERYVECVFNETPMEKFPHMFLRA